jgi:mRNA-degrading endonuclease RelE of RelBE toxin-antitoxin system
MPWTVFVKEPVAEHLRWFGPKQGRLLLEKAVVQLRHDPLAQSRNMKDLRPNPIAQRELRLFGKYRILFNVDAKEQTVTIVLAGEKRGNTLLVLGKEFTAHHESDSAE